MRELRQFRDSVVPAQVLELFHGWKIYDYLIYTRYRFLQRETRWKGLEDSLDECIDESVRTLDQMCFSSQYYMMMTVLTRRDFQPFPNFNIMKMASTRCHTALTPSTRAGAAAVS